MFSAYVPIIELQGLKAKPEPVVPVEIPDGGSVQCGGEKKMKRQKAKLLRERSHMRIYDILHGQKVNTDTHKKYSMKGPDREKRLEDIRKKISSGYYEQREVLEKIADAIYQSIRV